MKRDFLEAVKNRRTFYSIQAKSSVDSKYIEQVVQDAVKYCPTPFNSQSSRVVLLFGEEHKKLWKIVENKLKEIMPNEADFAKSKAKIESCFASGYGSILFFEDMSVVEKLQAQFPLYKDNFPVWANHASAMLQFVVWTALTDLGLGASLQHYGNLIEDQVKNDWKLAKSWSLIAQMPFGQPSELPQDKDFSPLSERFFVYK